MINNVTLMGRLVATPELRATQSGASVTNMTIAVDRNYVKPGEQRQADFIECVAWKGAAEFITKYFQKGSLIALTGSIQTRNYEDKNGNKRKATEILVDQVSFCGKSENNTQSDFEETAGDDDCPF